MSWSRRRSSFISPRPIVRLNVQELERRDNPAPMLTAVLSKSTLTLTGVNSKVLADNNQQIDLTQNAFGDITVTGLSGTTISGTGSDGTKATFSGVTALVINLNDGDDSVKFDLGPDPAVNVGLSGGVTIDGGKGNDLITIQGSTQIDGPLTIKGGDGANKLLFQDHASIRGNATLSGGAGGNQFIVSGWSQFYSDLMITSTDGDDAVQLGGDNSIVTLLGTTTVDLGKGTNTVQLGSSAGDVVRLTTFNYVGKNDTGADIINAAGAELNAGSLSLGVGAGANQVNLAADLVLLGALGIAGTSGADNLYLGKADPLATFSAGTTSIDAGNGQNLIAMGAGTTTLGKTTITAGTGKDTVSLGAGDSTFTTDAFKIDLGAGTGDNLMSIAGKKFAASWLVTAPAFWFVGGATSSNKLMIDGVADLEFNGLLRYATGGGADSLSITNCTSVTFENVDVQTGAGADQVVVANCPTVTAVDSISVQTGAGNDTFTLDNGTYSQGVTIKTAEGDDAIHMTGSVFSNFITLDAGTNNDTATLGGTFNDAVKLTGGTGNDSFTIDNSIFAWTLNVTAGDGNDGVHLTGDTFKNLVTIDGGNNNDSVTVGGAFSSSLGVTLGSGNDTATLQGLVRDPAGTTSVNLTGDAGDDLLTVNGGSLVNDLAFKGGDGNDKLSFGGDGTVNQVVNEIKFDYGSGSANVLTLGSVDNDVTVLGKLTVVGSAGAGLGVFSGGQRLTITAPLDLSAPITNRGVDLESNVIELSDVTVAGSTHQLGALFGKGAGSTLTAGKVTISTKGGGSSVDFDAATTNIASLTETTGGGNDQFQFGLYQTARDYHIAGAVTINQGAGFNYAYLQPQGTLTIDGLSSYTATAGHGGFGVGTIFTTNVLHGVNVSHGSAVSTTVAYGDTTNNGDFVVNGGGGANDTIYVYGDNFINTGKFAVDFGAGGSSVVLRPTSILEIDGDLTYHAFSGDDSIGMSAKFINTKSITADFGPGKTDFDVTASGDPHSFALLDGDVKVLRGTGTTLVQFENTTITGSLNVAGSTKANNALSVAGTFDVQGALTFTGGDANDFVSEYNSAASPVNELTFFGNVNVSLGDGNNEIQLEHVKFLAPVIITAGKGNDTVDLNSAEFISTFTGSFGDGDNSVTLGTDTFALNASITTGKGKDTISISSSELQANLQVISGAGDDVLELVSITYTAGSSVSLFTQAGNDTVTLFDGFIGGGSVDGGDGTDSINVPLDSPFVSGFEVQT